MTATAYRNITCDVTTPKNRLDRCAVVILNTLSTAAGVEVMVADLDAAIAKAGADVDYKTGAIKALRNIGYPIVVHKARHKTWYKMPGTSSEYETHRRSVVREAYSRQVSICRELGGIVAAMPNDPALAASYTHAQMTAMSLGTDPAVAMTISEVMADLSALTP